MTFRITILGSQKVGKTKLIKRLEEGKYSEDYHQTIEVEFNVAYYEGHQFQLNDTAGAVIYHPLITASLNSNDALILCLDGTKSREKQIAELAYWMEFIATYSNPAILFFIVYSKCDHKDFNPLGKGELRTIYARNRVSFGVVRLPEEPRYLTCSARTGTAITDVRAEIFNPIIRATPSYSAFPATPMRMWDTATDTTPSYDASPATPMRTWNIARDVPAGIFNPITHATPSRTMPSSPLMQLLDTETSGYTIGKIRRATYENILRDRGTSGTPALRLASLLEDYDRHGRNLWRLLHPRRDHKNLAREIVLYLREHYNMEVAEIRTYIGGLIATQVARGIRFNLRGSFMERIQVALETFGNEAPSEHYLPSSFVKLL